MKPPACDACRKKQARLPPPPAGLTPDSDHACVNPKCHVGLIHLRGWEPNRTAAAGSRHTYNRAMPLARAKGHL